MIVVNASGYALGNAEALPDLTQRQQASVGQEGSTVEASYDRNAVDG